MENTGASGRGDLPAPQDVVRRYANMVYRLAYARTGQKSDADDVMQDVFLRYLSHHAHMQSEEHVKAWLIRATINRSKSLLSSAWRRKTRPIAACDERAAALGEQSEVYLAVLQLPQAQRTVIHLYYYEDLSVKDVARLLGCSESAVKSRLHRARKQLRAVLGQDDPDLADA